MNHFPIKLSQAQRKVLADLFPAFRDRLKIEESHQRVIAFTAEELEEIGETARTAIDQATHGMVRNSLFLIVEIVSEALETCQGIGSIPAGQRIYQFRITLKDIEPTIWRRIQTRDCTLDKFHEHIQTSVGWTNSHLHEFEIDGQKYGDPDLLQENFAEFAYESSLDTNISQVLPKTGEQFGFDYLYDFGDGWKHHLQFEGVLRATRGERYPLCVEGKRCCPPEDVGGARGYAEFLKAIADPGHERHDEFCRWAGPFDPEAFDSVKATKKMRRGLPDWRQEAWI